MRRVGVLLAVGLLSGCKPAEPPKAKPGWQYLEWGMSPEAVTKASKGAVHLSGGDAGHQRVNLKIGAVGSYRSGNADHTIYAYFDRTGLAAIALEPQKGTNCIAIEDDLRTKYGAPVDDSIDGVAISYEWFEPSRQLRVNYHSGIGSLKECSVLFRPMLSAQAQGL